VLRSSGDILPSVASSAEIEPFLPRAATLTASRATSSPAAAIWSRMDVSSVARSDTVKSLALNSAGLSPPEGRNVKRKAGHFGPGNGWVEPRAGARHQRGYEETFPMPTRFGLLALAVILSATVTPTRAI